MRLFKPPVTVSATRTYEAGTLDSALFSAVRCPSVTARRPYARTGLRALKSRVTLRGLDAIDQRTAPARALVAWRAELVAALGGEAQISPQRRKLVEMTTRAALLLDHIDAWLFEQRTLVVRRALVPALVQRQALADHLARLLDKLGLDRVPAKLPALDVYVAERYGGNASQDGERDHEHADDRSGGSSRTPIPRDPQSPPSAPAPDRTEPS